MSFRNLQSEILRLSLSAQHPSILLGVVSLWITKRCELCNFGGLFKRDTEHEVMDIVAAGVVMTPALAIDGDVKVAGRVPDIEEMKRFLR